MRKFTLVALAIVICAAATVTLGQSPAPPTLRIVTEVPNLPSDLFYGDLRVKPLRLRPGTNVRITIDDSDFFVQQHYIDFFSRFPDESGFAFWNNRIAGCSGNPTCVDAERVNTSAAFFISTEFQNTGYFVYRFYRVGNQRQPRYAELIPDTRRIGQGVVVNAPGWEQQVEANKQAFAEAWVARSDFSAYAAMPAGQYVDALFANAGVTPSAADRQAAITAFGSGDTAGRARALRAVVENRQIYDREYNPAFVLMQYFGYLRRNPNDAPDTDLTGYNFWLGELNRTGSYGNMVRAFIVSGEYRDRF